MNEQNTCSVEELDAPSGATINPKHFTLTTQGQVIDVVVTNPYPAGKLAIQKTEVGDAAPGGTYTFDVDGPGANDFRADVAAGETWISDWLPLGTYSVTEQNPPPGHAIANNPAELTEDGTTVAVVATNPFFAPRGQLSITKVETGAAAPGGIYTFDVDGPGANDFQMAVAAGATTTVDGLPYGEYTIVEVDAPAGVEIAPNPVVLDEEVGTVAVTATNPYPAGKLAIRKVETGDGAPGGTYAFAVTGPADFTVDVAAGDTWTSGWLPLGSYTIVEVDAPGGHTISPNPATLEDGETVLVTATNPSPVRVEAGETGQISITKVETGPSAPGGTYTFQITGPFDVEATVAAGTTWTSGDLPVGTYTIVEVNAPEGHTIVPNPVVLSEEGQVVDVTATNPFPAAVQETVQATLPVTGGPGIAPTAAIAAGLVVIGAAALMVRRRSLVP